MADLVFAYTSPDEADLPYPPYFNLSRDGAEYTLTVRAETDRSGEYPLPGATATVRLTRARLEELQRAIAGELARPIPHHPV